MSKKQTATAGMEWNTMIGLSERLKKDKLYRDYMLVVAGSYFGLRISDLLKLKWGDVVGENEINLIEKKTKKKRRITINSAVHEAANICVMQTESGKKEFKDCFMFSNRWGNPITISYVNKRLKYIFKRYNVAVKNPSSHTLRKTFGKRVYEADNKSERALIYLSEIFSHSSISVTRRYIGITQEQIADVYLSI